VEWALKQLGSIVGVTSASSKVSENFRKFQKISENGQTDFAGEEFGNDGKEDGHDEEDVGRADLSRGGKFVGSTADFVHVKSDGKNQSRQTKQNHANEGDPPGVLRDPPMPVGGNEEYAGRRQTEDTQHYEDEGAGPLGRQVGVGADRFSDADGLAHLREAEFHPRAVRHNPFGIGQGSDSENVGQKKQTTGNHRQFIHDDGD